MSASRCCLKLVYLTIRLLPKHECAFVVSFKKQLFRVQLMNFMTQKQQRNEFINEEERQRQAISGFI